MWKKSHENITNPSRLLIFPTDRPLWRIRASSDRDSNYEKIYDDVQATTGGVHELH